MSRRYDRKTRDYSTTTSSSSGSETSSDASSLSEEALYMHAAHLEDYASAVAGTQMQHEKNSLAGLSLAELLNSSSSSATTSTTANAKNLVSLEQALPQMKSFVHKFESHQAMGALVNRAPTTATKASPLSGLRHASELSPQQLEAVHRNTQGLMQKRAEFTEISSLSTEKQAQLQARQAKSELTSFASLGALQKEQAVLNAQKNERLQQVVPLMDNSASILRQKGAFDLSFSATITDANLRTLFEGKPLECPTNSQHQAEAQVILTHLKKNHRHFCDLIDVGGLKTYMCDLVHRAGEDYLFLVPTKRYLEALHLDTDKVRAIKIIGSHIALFDRKSSAPVLNDMRNRGLYDYQSALYGHRIWLRRLDDKTIEVNGSWIAYRDTVGRGHLYIMRDVSPGQLVAEEKRVQLYNREALTHEARLIDLDNDPDLNLSYVEVDETLSARATELMQPVAHIGSYAEPKMSILLSKMLQANYNCRTDMRSYITLATSHAFSFASTGTGTGTNSATQCADLHVKLFDLHDAFNRHLDNTLQPLEYMRPVDACFISGALGQRLELGEALEMHEYKLDAQDRPFRKSDFLNHVAVVSFVRGDDVLMSSFAMTDEQYSKGVYMSASEGVVLRFKDNLLDCIAINPASPAFSAQLHEGDSVGVNQSVSLRLAVDKSLSAQLEAHEHTFEQFSDLVVPLCAPSFVKRAKAALKGAMTHSITLTPVNFPLSTENDAPVGPEATKSVMVMIGKNAIDAARNKHSHRVQRQTYQSRTRSSDHIDVFTFEKPFSFTALVDKKGRAKVLSLTVPHPLTQKQQTFTFKLSNTKNIASQIGWEGSKAGLTFHFETENGNVARLGIEYQKAPSGGSGRRSAPPPQDMPPQLPPPQNNPTPDAGGGGDVTAFLVDEAYRLHALSLPVSHAYLQTRLKSLLSTVNLTDRTTALRFFTALQEGLNAHPLDAPPLSVDSMVTLRLTELHRSIMAKHEYVQPTSAAIKQCSGLFESVNFSALNAQKTLDKVLEFATKKALSAPDRQLYVSRFACVLQEVLNVLKK